MINNSVPYPVVGWEYPKRIVYWSFDGWSFPLVQSSLSCIYMQLECFLRRLTWEDVKGLCGFMTHGCGTKLKSNKATMAIFLSFLGSEGTIKP